MTATLTAIGREKPAARRRGRRGNDEGSIFHRKDGRWVATLGMRDGKRRSVYGKSRQEVAKRLQEELRARDEGRPVPRDGETVGRFLTSWFDDHARAQLRPSTAASYAGILRLHLIPALGKSSITRLSPADVQRVLNQKASAGLSPRRIEYVRAVLRTALNDAVRWGLILRNPAALARGPRQPMREINPLSADQARQLLEAVRGDRTRGAVYGRLSPRTPPRRGAGPPLGGCRFGRWSHSCPTCASTDRRLLRARRAEEHQESPSAWPSAAVTRRCPARAQGTPDGGEDLRRVEMGRAVGPRLHVITWQTLALEHCDPCLPAPSGRGGTPSPALP